MSRDAFKVGLGQGKRRRRPRLPARLRHVGRTSEEAHHPCGRLCSSCGFIDRPRLDDGYRVGAGAGAQGDCPNCGANAWLDLGQDDVVQALAENEAFASSDAAEESTMASAGVAAVGGLGVAAAIALAQTAYVAGFVVVAVVAATVAFILGVTVGTRVYRALRAPQSDALPSRWHLALPSSEGPSFERTRATLSGEPVSAPLSGVPCLAYDVGARVDDDASASLGSWLLIEQNSAELACDEHRVSAGEAFLEIRSRKPFEVRDANDEARVSRFLRERGFESHSVVLYETIVPAHGSAVAHGDGGRVILELDDRPALQAAEDS